VDGGPGPAPPGSPCTDAKVQADAIAHGTGLTIAAALYADAVTEAQARLKPRIPGIGDYRIPIRDEVEFEKRLCSGPVIRG